MGVSSEGKINLSSSNFKNLGILLGLKKKKNKKNYSASPEHVMCLEMQSEKPSANLNPKGNQHTFVEILGDLHCLVFTMQTNKCHLSCNFHHGT